MDLVFSNLPNQIENIKTETPFSGSDHLTISFSLPVSTPFKQPGKIMHNFAKADWNKANLLICNINWNAFLQTFPTIDQKYTQFTKFCLNVIKECVPLKTPCAPYREYSFVKTARNRMYKYFRERHSRGFSPYWKTVRQYRRACMKAKRKIEDSIYKTKNSKRFYNYARNRLKTISEPSNIKTANEIITNDAQKAKAFASYFHSVYKNENSSFPTLVPSNEKIDYVDITGFAISKLLHKLPNRNSTSPDNIPYTFLKNTADTICVPLCILYNFILLNSQLPTIWKTSIVKPIFKSGNKSDITNYRPISLTCSSCKIFERIICKQLLEFLITNKVISPYQHGFLYKRSTETALLSSINLWNNELDKKSHIDICYIDFKKAFDTIPITALITKLEATGISGCLLKTISSFLKDRTAKVQINDSSSKPYKITSGVPQGSCISPLLFILFINDIGNDLPSSVKFSLFADDMKLWSINNSHDFQVALNKLGEWSNTWKMELAPHKCFTFHLGYEPTHKFLLLGKEIAISTEIRDLGVEYNNKLEFTPHILSICKKASKVCNFILSSYSTRNIHTLYRLFIVYARPILEYCSTVFSPTSKELINSIENIQANFTRRIFLRSCTNSKKTTHKG